MHRHEFRFVATAQIMDGVRGQFFSGAALAFNQHIGRGGCDLPDGVEHLVQSSRVAPNVLEAVALVHLLAKRAIFLLEFATLHRARDHQFDFVEIERLRDKIVGAALHRFHRDIDGAVCSHHDANGRARHFQGAIDQLHSIFTAEA